MTHDILLVEDTLLLMLDDESGAIAGAGTLHYTLGGAMLVDLALRGRVEIEEGPPGLNGPRVTAVGDGPLEDPLLQAAYEKVAERRRGAQTLLLTIGAGLWEDVVDRLVERGLVRREQKRVLGLFRSTRWPAEDSRHEAEVLEAVRAVFEDGAIPDPRTAALGALLSASGTLPSLHPDIRWSSATYHRGKELEEGDWGAAAVSTAVARTVAAISASSAAVVASTIAVTSSGS